MSILGTLSVRFFCSRFMNKLKVYSLNIKRVAERTGSAKADTNGGGNEGNKG